MPATLGQVIGFTLSVEQLQQSRNAPVRTKKASMCGYEWYVECRAFEQESEREFSLLAIPCDDCDAFDLLVDYELTVTVESMPMKLIVDHEIINSTYASEEDRLPTLRVSGPGFASETTKDCSLSARINVRDVLTVRRADLTVETNEDNFVLLAASKMFYVNLRYLASLGSQKFAELLERTKRGLRRKVILSASPEELDVFLSALCRYGRPVVTSRNWLTVLSLALEFGMSSVVQLCEVFLINAKSIHAVRKLEYSLQYKLPYLMSAVVRQVQHDECTPIENLHHYLESNGEELCQMHPSVLKKFGVYDEYVII